MVQKQVNTIKASSRWTRGTLAGSRWQTCCSISCTLTLILLHASVWLLSWVSSWGTEMRLLNRVHNPYWDWIVDLLWSYISVMEWQWYSANVAVYVILLLCKFIYSSGSLTNRYNMGVISTKKSLVRCEKLSVSSFCRSLSPIGHPPYITLTDMTYSILLTL